jgi:hypothetical protein
LHAEDCAPDSHPSELRPRTSVKALRGRTLLFSEARQAIFELDD